MVSNNRVILSILFLNTPVNLILQKWLLYIQTIERSSEEQSSVQANDVWKCFLVRHLPGFWTRASEHKIYWRSVSLTGASWFKPRTEEPCWKSQPWGSSEGTLGAAVGDYGIQRVLHIFLHDMVYEGWKWSLVLLNGWWLPLSIHSKEIPRVYKKKIFPSH